ncbi:hypothetical protein llap_15271 [Limosa lapponica baueri]|uniref:Uncharacterized protein n=1 Tax=Limosa lapponica baueri TaxID=1758121 RepID=A0A2I0TL24_LIMLA|nr:hypothetical protein llap_15271 [Limosa lapponica baueri]
MGDVVVGVCYSLPDQEEVVDDAFFRQLEEASLLQALVHLNHPDIYWKDHIAGYKKSMRLPECIDDNFLTQVIKEPMRGGTLLNLIFAELEM